MIVVDRSAAALELARICGADHTVLADGSQTAKVKELTSGHVYRSKMGPATLACWFVDRFTRPGETR